VRQDPEGCAPYAIRTGRPHRANGQMAAHVLDVFHVVIDSSTASQYIELASTCECPRAMPLGCRTTCWMVNHIIRAE
jgi:hypothetical protein